MGTFAATIKGIGFMGIHNRMQEDIEFLEIGTDIFSSEELVDSIYEILTPLIVKEWEGLDRSTVIDDIGEAYYSGFYLPCAKRVSFTGQVDLKNDGLPEYASYCYQEPAEGDEPARWIVVSARKVCTLPHGIVNMTNGVPYALTSFFWNAKGTVKALTHHISVKPNGECFHCVNKLRSNDGMINKVSRMECAVLAVTLNAWADRRSLWTIETHENLVGKHRTPLILGVDEQQAASLFYARQNPIAPSGRKRPILHWVRSHARRLQGGIEIDIRRHMRGVEEFEMDGFKFRITSPSKQQ